MEARHWIECTRYTSLMLLVRRQWLVGWVLGTRQETALLRRVPAVEIDAQYSEWPRILSELRSVWYRRRAAVVYRLDWTHHPLTSTYNHNNTHRGRSHSHVLQLAGYCQQQNATMQTQLKDPRWFRHQQPIWTDLPDGAIPGPTTTDDPMHPRHSMSLQHHTTRRHQPPTNSHQHEPEVDAHHTQQCHHRTPTAQLHQTHQSHQAPQCQHHTGQAHQLSSPYVQDTPTRQHQTPLCHYHLYTFVTSSWHPRPNTTRHRVTFSRHRHVTTTHRRVTVTSWHRHVTTTHHRVTVTSPGQPVHATQTLTDSTQHQHGTSPTTMSQPASPACRVQLCRWSDHRVANSTDTTTWQLTIA